MKERLTLILYSVCTLLGLMSLKYARGVEHHAHVTDLFQGFHSEPQREPREEANKTFRTAAVER